MLSAPESVNDPRWVLVVPEARDYDNLVLCHARKTPECHQPIVYVGRELPSLRGHHAFSLAQVAELAAPGTHRLFVAEGSAPTTFNEDFVSALPQIVVRRGDDYVGLLSELFGVPFVLWPQKLKTGHQTDLRLGADCSALVVYGQRRLGRRIPYVSPRGLFQLARELSEGEPLQRGDILNYGFQSAVLSVDTPPLGQLNPEDRVIQTYHGVAEELPLSTLPFRDAPVRFLRWPETPGP
jgi:hypothetical protein